MKITSLEVDGYGVWTGLRLDGLAEGLNVFCGPNEAGKSTLMQFIRSVLYGFSPERQRYLPPLRGGRPGGSLHVASPNGRFEVTRHADDAPAPAAAQAVLTAADGTRQGQHFLKVLLCDVDEAVFNNVFAVGLREMQELATLSDTEAASLLYSLSAGLDRVSLIEVLRELETLQNQLLDSPGQSGQVLQLLAQREQIRGEIEELSKLTGQYARGSAARDQLDAEAVRLEEEKTEIEHRCRVVELAMTVADRWRQRRGLDDQLSALHPPPPLPSGALEQLDRLNARLRTLRERAQRLRGRHEQLRAEADALPVSQALWRQAPRIEALEEQAAWIESLKSRIAALQSELSAKHSQLAAQRERLGLPPAGADPLAALPSLSLGLVASFRRPARALRAARDRLAEARTKTAAEEQTARSLGEQIDAPLRGRGGDLPAAIERAGSLVAQLRRRTQLDERLEQLDRYQAELDQQSRRLLARQLLPAWVLVGLGAIFVVGFMLIMAGLFMPESLTGSFGWALALLGLGGAGVAGGAKVLLERSNARQLDACQKQINMLQLQAKQAREDRDALQRQLPPGGPTANPLQAAEADLAALEQLLPVDARRRAAQQEAAAVKGNIAEAENDLAAARARWRAALAQARLPETFSPKQLGQLARCSDEIEQLVRQIRRDQEELDQRRRELDTIGQRIAQLAVEAEATVPPGDPVEQLRALAAAIAEQETRVQQRDALRHRARRLRRKLAKLQTAATKLKYRRRDLLERAGVATEEEFRQRALGQAHAETLRRQRAALQAEIDATIGGQCSEQAVAEQLAGDGADLDARRRSLQEGARASEAELARVFEKRGALGEQLRALAEDRRMSAKQFELVLLDQRLRQAVRRWQVLAATRRMLDRIRDTYQRERQPETLQEASGYLDRMTRGRYQRVWTPLGEEVLRVDDAQGRSLSVESLSRGTREQLFLSLRLALANSYARRGAPLPLVLDDVLVNFDLERARAAGAVLRDFANAGHQLLVFTCHEHISKLFKSLKVEVHRLPDSAAPEAIPATAAITTKPRRRPAVRPTPRELVADSEPDWEDDDPAPEGDFVQRNDAFDEDSGEVEAA